MKWKISFSVFRFRVETVNGKLNNEKFKIPSSLPSRFSILVGHFQSLSVCFWSRLWNEKWTNLNQILARYCQRRPWLLSSQRISHMSIRVRWSIQMVSRWPKDSREMITKCLDRYGLRLKVELKIELLIWNKFKALCTPFTHKKINPKTTFPLNHTNFRQIQNSDLINFV